MVLGGGKEAWGGLKKGKESCHSWGGIKMGKELERQSWWKYARIVLVHLNIGKDYLINISEANVTPLTNYLIRRWVNASIRPKLYASFFQYRPKSRKSLSHQSQRTWLGQIPPALLWAESGRTLQRWYYLRKARTQTFIPWKKPFIQVKHPRRPRWSIMWHQVTGAKTCKHMPQYRKFCQVKDWQGKIIVVVLPGRVVPPVLALWLIPSHLWVFAVTLSLPSWSYDQWQSGIFVPYLQDRERHFGSSLAGHLLAADGERVVQIGRTGKEVTLP